MLSDALVNSPVVAGEDGQIPVGGGSMGGGFGFDFDPNEDPELALVSGFYRLLCGFHMCEALLCICLCPFSTQLYGKFKIFYADVVAFTLP